MRTRRNSFSRPTELGFLVTDLLVKNFPDILNVQFTSQMENNLDQIEEGKMNWIQVLENFLPALCGNTDQGQGRNEAGQRAGVEDRYRPAPYAAAP